MLHFNSTAQCFDGGPGPGGVTHWESDCVLIKKPTRKEVLSFIEEKYKVFEGIDKISFV
jgi:hypothetical protein